MLTWCRFFVCFFFPCTFWAKISTWGGEGGHPPNLCWSQCCGLGGKAFVLTSRNADSVEVLGPISWNKSAKEAETNGRCRSCIPSRRVCRSSAAAQLFPDVDSHRTKFSLNSNKTQSQQGFSHSLWKVSISVASELSKRSSGGTKFVLTAKKCRRSRGHVALATRTVTDDDGWIQRNLFSGMSLLFLLAELR